MPVIHITKTTVERLTPPEKGQVDYFDDSMKGFGVRVSPTAKTYFTMRRVNGKLVRAKIDSADKITAEKARKQAESMLSDMGKGNDPNELKREKVRLAEEKAKEITVANLCTEYIERHAKKFKRSWEADERLLNIEIIPTWGKRKASAITKRDVTLLLESIIDRGTPAMSNQVLKITRKMFNFGVERDILPYTPFTGVKALAPNNSRERTMSETEIKTLWGSIDNAAMSDEIRRALKLVLVTAQRPGEVTGMHVKEIDGHWWTIPAERAKNGQEHRVYLTDTALELIGDTTGKGFIFPSPHQAKEQPIDAHALPVAVRRNLDWPLTDKKGKPLYGKDGKPATENRLMVDKWTPHDLRRTAATFMASMGYMDEIIDAVLNHLKQGIIRTYNRHGYDKEKQLALEAWGRKLVAITTGTESNVIPLRRKAAGEE
jgi:integrase